MKNKQINKFLLMFLLSFTLFFSVSYAEFSITPIMPISTFGSSSDISHYRFGDYTIAQILDISNNYYYNPDNSDYKTMFFNMNNNLSDNGLDYLFFDRTQSTDGESYIGFTIFKKGAIDFSFYLDGTTLKLLALVNSDISSSDGYVYVSLGSTYCQYFANKASGQFRYYDLSSISSFSILSSSFNVKEIKYNGGYYWDGTSYYYESSSSGEEDIPTISNEEFAGMLNEVTTSELFYQHVPSNYRSHFFVQHDINNDNYLFYFYPSNYQVNGLRRNENDYHILCDKNFSWWDNVVDFLKKKFTRETENLNYEMIYVKILEDGTYSCWYRSKPMLSVDETLFNFDLNPIVYSSVQIPFYGQHGGGGIDIDSGDKTLATEPEYVVNDQVYGESNIVYNPTPIEKVSGEQDFWDKVVNRLSSMVSYIKNSPFNIINELYERFGFEGVISFVMPLISGIVTIIGVLISSIALISRAVTFVYTLPTIEASSSLFSVDVAETTTGLSFTGYSWGARFLEGLDMLRNFSWNGLNLWNLFSAFIAAMFAIQVVKYIRRHYHY